eukprot:4966964-Prorocentrum_lima.AAC.1
MRRYYACPMWVLQRCLIAPGRRVVSYVRYPNAVNDALLDHVATTTGVDNTRFNPQQGRGDTSVVDLNRS